MKKIILVMAMLFMSVSTLPAAGNQYALKHANPMPNLMRIAIKNADLLGVDAKQMTALKAWSETNKPKMQEMVKKVMSEEKMLHEKALTSDADTSKEAEVMLETRKQIIAMKTKCNATLKTILTKKQYADVITIYRSVR
ncbi:MAG: hypothetical protein COB07_01005 [Sulfurovum sp.]|nr:MAG: hypothetical protein COB07_01005 [Sulfurovum sp.]